jgi:hypothetical protein
MSLDSFVDNFASLDFAIKTCIESRLTLPSLVLIYSAMDIVASLERQPGDGIGHTFKAWVDRYALKARPLSVTSTDLYSARCAVLHTLTADSDLTRAGKARKICYAWGSGDPIELQEAIRRAAGVDAAVLHIEDLRWALLDGLHLWYTDIHSDSARFKVVEAAAATWFINVPKDHIKRYLEKTDPGPAS